MKILESIKNAKQRWEQNRIIKIPTLKFHWDILDFRPWHYAWIDGEKCDWWACGDELDDLKKRYGKDIRFEKIPWRKTVYK